MLVNKTVVSQSEEEFILFAAVEPGTRAIRQDPVASSRNFLTTWRFFEQLDAFYGRVPPIVVTDGPANYGPVFSRSGITHVVRIHGLRNTIECWIQGLKRQIDTVYDSFTGKTARNTNDGRWQFPGV